MSSEIRHTHLFMVVVVGATMAIGAGILRSSASVHTTVGLVLFLLFWENCKGLKGWRVSGLDCSLGQQQVHSPLSSWQFPQFPIVDCRPFCRCWPARTQRGKRKLNDGQVKYIMRKFPPLEKWRCSDYCIIPSCRRLIEKVYGPFTPENG